MSMIELAERKGRTRAFSFCGFAAAILLLLLLTMGVNAPPFFHGLWLGITCTSALSLTPFMTRLKANGPLARLLDDETAIGHRQSSSVFGLWAALLAALAMLALADSIGTVSASTTARVIISIAVASALLRFGTLELRAAR